MQENTLKEILEHTFARVACPLQGNGIYAELQHALMAAYNLGKQQTAETILPVPAGS